MNCAYELQKDCLECERNSFCPIYNDFYVLRDQAKKLKKTLEDSLTIVKAVLEKQ